MLIHKTDIKLNLDEAVDQMRNGVNKVDRKEMVYGLTNEIWYRRRGEELTPYYDVYIERNNKGKIESYALCATFERGAHIKYPGCSHRFFDKNLYYKIYYNKEKYLHEWSSQKSKAIAFIDGFEIIEEEDKP